MTVAMADGFGGMVEVALETIDAARGLVDFAHYDRLLDHDERRRLADMGAAGPAVQYLVSHGLARRLLSRLLDVEPAALGFWVDGRGKRWLTEPALARQWSLSISHTTGMVGVAAARSCALGFDVQHVRRQPDLQGVAAEVCGLSELAALSALGEPGSPPWMRRFFTMWTVKEAWLKACGLGASMPARYCEVEVDEQGARIVRIDPTAGGEAERWQVRAWWPGPEHAACLVHGSA